MVEKNDDIMVYYRIRGSERILMALNFSGKDKLLSREGQGGLKVLFSAHRAAGSDFAERQLHLAPYEATVLEVI
jgi:hypothetical protein